MLKKYVISIEDIDSHRFNDFFERNNFCRTDFIVKGVKGIEAPVSDYFLRAVLGAVLPLTPSEFGCKESHISCLRNFLSSDDEYAVFFEDDIVKKTNFDFDFDFSVFGENFIFYLGDLETKKARKFRIKKMNFNFSGRKVGKLPICFSYSLYGTYAYVLDRKCAEKYLAFLERPHVADDWSGFSEENKKINFYISDCFYHPQIGDADHFSVIEHERMKRKNASMKNNFIMDFLKRRKIKFLRILLSFFLSVYRR